MSRRIPFYIVDSFTDTLFQGNPAGVFFDDAASLTAGEMQKLAGEVSLESAFVQPCTGDADFRLRYFTGVCEVPFCGHDTVATAVVLAQTGRVSVPTTIAFETNVGVIPTAIERQGEHLLSATLLQQPAQFRDPLGGAEIPRLAGALGYAVEEIGAADLPAQWTSTGTPWLLVPVSSRGTVDRTPSDFAAISALSREWETFGVYVFAVERDSDNRLQIWSRCYAPIAGLNEDPVTGSASGALGGYLARYRLLDEHSPSAIAWQGFAGGRGGTARITLKPHSSIAVTGTARVAGEGYFTLPG